MTEVSAGFVVFRRNGGEIEYLLLQTSFEFFHWTPPKGHPHQGETEMETALRETEEESGLVKDDLHIFEDCRMISNYMVIGVPKTVTYWLAELTNPNAVVTISGEHQAYKWLNYKEAYDYARFRELRKLLKDVNTYIEQTLV